MLYEVITIAKGIPEKEIEFIHNADSDVKKKQLFGRVRSGDVRILLGSTAKMGAGTSGLRVAELAFEHARERVAEVLARGARRELQVQLGLAQRGGEPPLEVGAAGAAGERGVQRHDGVEVRNNFV